MPVELTLTQESLAEALVVIARDEGRRIVGMVEIAIDGDVATLEKLFVVPEAMGAGSGRLLFAWARSEARARGGRILTIDSDPAAADF